MASCRNCGHTEKMCKCGGGRMRKAMPRNKQNRMEVNLTPTPEPSYENGFPIERGRIRTGYTGNDYSRRYRPSALTPPSFYIDPMDPRNDWAYDQYRGAQEWEKASDFMEGKNHGGLVVEQTPDSYVSYRTPLRDYEYGRFPKGLVEGRKLFGLPGGRSARGVGTAKSMSKAYKPQFPPMPGTSPKRGPVIRKESISVPDKLKAMINNMLGIGRSKNVNPAAVAAALIANRQGGTLGMKDYEPRTSPSSIGPRKSDVINTINALVSRQRVRDPENPNFIPFKQRETLRRERMPSSGSGLDKSMMKAYKPRKDPPPSWEDKIPPYPDMNFERGGKPKNFAGFMELAERRAKRPKGPYQPRIQGGPTGGSMAMKSMMKSISSMNQGGVRHVVGGYRGGKMSKAMAASQTQTRNRYM